MIHCLLPHTIYTMILYKYFACDIYYISTASARFTACFALAGQLAPKTGLISQIGRKHIGDAFFNGIAFLAGRTAELACHNLFLVLLEYL